jgi:hypothetical protein
MLIRHGRHIAALPVKVDGVVAQYQENNHRGPGGSSYKGD